MISTTYLYRKQFGLAGTGLDARISFAISIAHAAIEAHCGRTLTNTLRLQWLDGTGTDLLLLPEWPITALNGIAVSGIEAMSISSTFDHAAASTSETGITLSWFDTAGDPQTSTLPWTTYKTLATLAVAVNGVAGWSATVAQGYGGHPSRLIKPFVTGSCAVNDSVDLMIPDEWIEASIDAQSNQTIRRAGAYERSLAVFPEGNANVFVWYAAGYVVPVDNGDASALATDGNVPADLTAVCNVVAKAAMSAAIGAGGVQSENFGNYSYSLASFPTGIKSAVDAAIESQKQSLAPYRKMI